MKINVIIDGGCFRTTMPVKLGAILLHPDWPLGIAARDIEADEILEYSSHKNTKDVILKWRKAMNEKEKTMNEKSSNIPKFSEREVRLIENCQVYAANDPAGIPGHNLMIIIAKLSSLLVGGELEEATEHANSPQL